jgi:hypothetical protein
MAIAGIWKVIARSPMGDQELSLAFAENGNKLTGTQTSAFGSDEILNGVISGNTLSWTIEMTKPLSMTLQFKAEVEGNSISGVVKAGAFGESRFSGARA